MNIHKELTPEVLASLVGRQMGIQNQDDGYIYCGEIKSLDIKELGISATFTWFAKGDAFPTTSWKVDRLVDMYFPFGRYAVTKVVPSEDDVGSDHRWLLTCAGNGEIVTIFTPGCPLLDPSCIEGLEIV